MQKQKELESTKPRGPLDLHAIIKELAEAVLECHSGLAHDYGTCAAGCEDGYIIPFKALRVPYDLRRWQPEPDIERACWRVFEFIVGHPSIIRWQVYYAAIGDLKQAVLRAAEAWLEGQRCGM